LRSSCLLFHLKTGSSTQSFLTGVHQSGLYKTFSDAYSITRKLILGLWKIKVSLKSNLKLAYCIQALYFFSLPTFEMKKRLFFFAPIVYISITVITYCLFFFPTPHHLLFFRLSVSLHFISHVLQTFDHSSCSSLSILWLGQISLGVQYMNLDTVLLLRS